MDNPQQNKIRGNVIGQCYSMLKTPRAEPVDTRTQLPSKGQGQHERGRRLEQRTNK